MVKLVNRAKMKVASGGAGTLTLGAACDGYQTFAAGGVTDQDKLRYAITDGNDWEIGVGTYTASGTTLARAPTESSNSGNAITCGSDAEIFVTMAAEDFTDNAAPTFENTIPATLELSGGATSTINAKALDDDGFPISYSFDAFSGSTVYSASSLPPQLTSVTADQTSGVFSLAATSSTSGSGSVNFRVRASDGVRTATKSVLCNLSFFPPGKSDVLGFYDVGDTSSYSGSGTTWSDISPNSGPNLTLSSSVSYNSSGIGSVPSLSVSNSGAVTYSGTAFSTSGNSTATIVAILQTNYPATPNHFQYFQNLTSPAQQGLNAHSTQSFLALYGSGSGNLTSQTGSDADTLYIDGVAKQNLQRSELADLLFDSAAVRAQMHSIVVQTCNLDAGFSLGTDSDDGRAINGQIRALIIYNRKITQTEIDAIHDYYKDVYTSNTHMPA
jgi:hypothetical protein